MDTATALWAAAIGAGTALVTVTLFGALVGRRFRTRARSRGFGGPPWAFAGAHAHAHGPGHPHARMRMMAAAGGACGGGWGGRCEGRRRPGADEQPEASAAPAEPAEA
jgi:hypothetical protein